MTFAFYLVSLCHPREGGDPGFLQMVWIPAFAGMTTENIVYQIKKSEACNASDFLLCSASLLQCASQEDSVCPIVAGVAVGQEIVGCAFPVGNEIGGNDTGSIIAVACS